jgi:PKD repeat protein
VDGHDYSAAGTYTVTLTVVDDVGQQATVAKSVAVGTGTAPTVDFVFSPSAPVVGQQVQFNANASAAAPGRTIVKYQWNWGDGDIDTGKIQQHVFTAAGTYNVTLTITDDLGVTAAATKSVPVGSGNPTASFTFAPTVPAHTMLFDGSSSTAVGSATIVSYEWSFGDGGSDGPNPGPTTSHTYAGAGTFPVRLTVTDSLGRTGTFTTSVSVP